MSILRCRPVIVPSSTKTVDECEDAFATNGNLARAAVADGATWSVNSGQWATLLTRSFCSGTDARNADSFVDWVDDLAGRMTEDLARQANSGEDHWWSEESAARGSAAAFLGIELTEGEEGRVLFQALAVGDCCLFHVRGDSLLRSWPLTAVEEFNSSPVLIESTNSTSPSEVLRMRGEARSGDYLLLASDAVAQWLLGLAAAEPDRISTVVGIDQGNWEELIDWLRNHGSIVDDDCTLMTVQVVGSTSS